jgi:hypothetical protein
MKLLLFISMVFLPVSSQAITWEEFWSPFYHGKSSYYNRHTNSVCYKNVYREQYIPGNKWSPGHVRSWVERVTVPCYY